MNERTNEDTLMRFDTISGRDRQTDGRTFAISISRFSVAMLMRDKKYTARNAIFVSCVDRLSICRRR